MLARSSHSVCECSCHTLVTTDTQATVSDQGFDFITTPELTNYNVLWRNVMTIQNSTRSVQSTVHTLTAENTISDIYSMSKQQANSLSNTSRATD